MRTLAITLWLFTATTSVAVAQGFGFSGPFNPFNPLSVGCLSGTYCAYGDPYHARERKDVTKEQTPADPRKPTPQKEEPHKQ